MSGLLRNAGRLRQKAFGLGRNRIEASSKKQTSGGGNVFWPVAWIGLETAWSSATGPKTMHRDAGSALATQRVECFLQAFSNAGKNRRIAQRITAALGFSQCHDKI